MLLDKLYDATNEGNVFIKIKSLRSAMHAVSTLLRLCDIANAQLNAATCPTMDGRKVIQLVASFGFYLPKADAL